jgi:hypothetical protein
LKLQETWEIYRNKASIFLLLPSSTSSPENLILCEFALVSLGLYIDIFPEDKISYLRLDDYMLYGDKVVEAMADAGKRIYPQEEMKSMLNFIEGGDESQFNKCLKNYFAWVYLPFGVRDDYSPEKMDKGIEALLQLSEVGDEIALPSIDGCPPPKGLEQPLSPSCSVLSFSMGKKAPCFVAMNASTATKYESDIGKSIQVIPSSDSEEEFNSFAEENSSGIVFLLDCADHMVTISDDDITCPITSFTEKYRSKCPRGTISMVLFADSYEALSTNPYLTFLLNCFVENTDTILLATHDEAVSVGNFYGKTKDPNENPGMILFCQQCPFPRLKLFTFSTTLGQTLEDRNIMFPAVTVGPNNSGSGLSIDKFIANEPGKAFMFSGGVDDGLIPSTERVIPGSGDKNATIIQPYQLIYDLLSGVSKCWEEEISKLSLAEKVSEQAELAKGNVMDLSAEYQAYKETIEQQEEEE